MCVFFCQTRYKTNEPVWVEAFTFLIHNPKTQQLEVEVCMHTHTHARTHARTHPHTHTHTHTPPHSHRRTHRRTHTHTYTHTKLQLVVWQWCWWEYQGAVGWETQ